MPSAEAPTNLEHRVTSSLPPAIATHRSFGLKWLADAIVAATRLWRLRLASPETTITTSTSSSPSCGLLLLATYCRRDQRRRRHVSLAHPAEAARRSHLRPGC